MQNTPSNDTFKHVSMQINCDPRNQYSNKSINFNTLGKDIDFVLKLDPSDILALINIDLGPVRAKCAILGLQVLQHGLLDAQKNKKL